MIKRGTKKNWALLPAALLAVACAHKGIDEGTQIQEIVQPKDEAPPTTPIVETQEVAPDPNRALENYEKLLDLPQDAASRAETMRRLADLNLEVDEQSGGTDLKASDARQRKAISLYNTVLTEQPTSPNNDRVLYQLARAYQNVGENGHAEETLMRLTREYPQSSYADDAHFRRAELLFKLQQFDDASAEYRKVLELGEATPFFQSAQYKYGWSEYRQSNFESAIGVFLTILTRELPPGELVDQKSAFEAVAKGKKDMSADALRVISLSFTQLGGGDAANKYFAAKGEPPYSALIYLALGDHLLEKKRYTDSAATFESFVRLHPKHDLAPKFMTRAIAAQDLGGFIEPVVAYKEKYVKHFDPSSPYWAGRTPAADVMADLHKHLEDLARFYQARAQKSRKDAPQPGALNKDGKPALPDEHQTPAAIKADFEAATAHYGRLLELYPSDPKAAELRFLRAEALFDSGNTQTAADEYTKVATQFPTYEKAADAAYAALLAYQKRATEVPEAQKNAALKQSVAAGLLLADKFPQHPQATAALMRAGEDQYVLQQWDDAIKTADRVLKLVPPVPDALRRTAWAVTSDANFSLKRFPAAEVAYTELLKLTPADAPDRKQLTERLASSIYKQGEAARDAKDSKGAAAAFLRVGTAVPDASIRATADYDAAAMLIAAADWNAAITVLEGFRTRNPGSPQLPDIDKKLSVVYQNAGRPKDSAEVLKRIAASGVETGATRAEAAWLSATLLDQAKDPGATAAYEKYQKEYPQPFDRRIEALQKLADYAQARNDAASRTRWLSEIIAADTAAGSSATPRSHQLAAQGVLEAARVESLKAQKVELKQPLKQSVPLKKAAVEAAIAQLKRAADYGFAEVTTAATYETGVLYQNFSQALLKSPRPPKMGALEREQYDLLLEEQAFPIEEKAISFHEANLQLVQSQGTYTQWTGKSLAALTEMAPGKYAKREQGGDVYDAEGPATPVSTNFKAQSEVKSAVAAPVAPMGQAAPKPAAPQAPAAAPAAPAADAPAAPLTYIDALAAMKSKQWAVAEPVLLAAAKANPQLAGPQANLGIVYAHTNRRPEALAAFNKAAAINPRIPLVQNWLGMLARENNDLVRAESFYKAALALDASYAPAQLNLAILNDQYLKRPADALAAYQKYEALSGKKELKTSVWIAEMQSLLPATPAASPASPAPVSAPAPAPVAGPNKPAAGTPAPKPKT